MATHSVRLMQFGLFVRTLVFCGLFCLQTMPTVHAQYVYEQFDDYDLVMYERPKLTWNVRQSVTFSPGLVELWSLALDRPDAELQRLVIDTLAIAHGRGVEGVAELKPRLVAMASQPEQSLEVLRALMQTLVQFDARDQTQLMADAAKKHGAPIGEIVEPAIAQWKSPVLEQAWIDRISGPPTGSSLTLLAIEGLAAIESQRAATPLRALVRNVGGSSQVRMAAARALGELQDSGLVDFAGELVSIKSRPESLHPILATQLLSRHSDEKSVELLTSLLTSESSVVQSEVLKQLYRIDFRLVDAQRERLVESPDVNVRRQVLQAMVDSKQADRMPRIAQLLDDVNPALRRQASSGMIDLAQDSSLREVAIAEAMRMLNGDQWRGCEQACVVLTRLNHLPSGKRMVELLGHERGEVQVAAAWGLSKLKIPELLPAMLEHAQSVYEGFRSNQLSDTMPGKAMHMAHLFTAFGDQGYRPAEPLMREYLPKNHSLGLESRGAATWAIGLFYEGNLQPDLVSLFVGRLYDNGRNADTDEVRNMAAIALGRMKAESALPDLRKFASQGMIPCYWAIEQMTGEPIPTPGEQVTVVDDWFLAPIRNQPE